MTRPEEWRTVVRRVVNDWTILTDPDADGKALCRCSCGTETRVLLKNIFRGLSRRCRSCSSRQIFTKHGASICGGAKNEKRLYRIWKAMKWRCNPKNQSPDAYYYHVRGISVCKEWQDDFAAFRVWAFANGYDGCFTLDRWPDQNGNYEPTNCRWVTPQTQARNTRRNLIITAFGETKTAAEWVLDSRCVVKRATLCKRIASGWGLMSRPSLASLSARDLLSDQTLIHRAQKVFPVGGEGLIMSA